MFYLRSRSLLLIGLIASLALAVRLPAPQYSGRQRYLELTSDHECMFGYYSSAYVGGQLREQQMVDLAYLVKNEVMSASNRSPNLLRSTGKPATIAVWQESAPSRALFVASSSGRNTYRTHAEMNIIEGSRALGQTVLGGRVLSFTWFVIGAARPGLRASCWNCKLRIEPRGARDIFEEVKNMSPTPPANLPSGWRAIVSKPFLQRKTEYTSR